MRKLLTFKILSQIDTGIICIFSDKIVAVRKWGEGVRLFTDAGTFDVADTLQEVLDILGGKL